MLYDDFYNEFLISYDKRDLKAANTALMKTMGNVISQQREDFIDLMTEAGVEGDFNSMSDAELVDLYVESLSNIKPLRLGSALIVNMQLRSSDFNGEPVLNDAATKAAYHTLCVFYREPSENYSQAVGGIIAGALGEGAKFGSKLSDAQQKKKYGATDMAAKKAEAKAAITAQLLANRQAEAEAKRAAAESKAKTTKVILIASASVVGLSIIGFIIYKLVKK